MPLSIPSQSELLSQYLKAISNKQPDADTGEDSDFAIRGNATASTVWGFYQFAAWVLRQLFPDTADTDWLALHARHRGLTKKVATAASGQATVTGTAGTKFNGGLQFRIKGNSMLYQTTEDGVIDDDGNATVSAKALTAGTAGNIASGSTGTLVSAPSGLDSSVTIVLMNGGTDTETDSELLARLLDVMRTPPAGGNAHDYKVWAMSISGVSGAWVFPLRRGLGTVDVAITATDGLPSAETLNAVQTYIDSVRPVTAKDCIVFAPTEKTLDVTVQVGISDDTTMESVTDAITKSLNTWFAALIPGQEAIRTQIGALISDVDGVLDYELIAPATNMTPVVDDQTVEWIRPGSFSITQLSASQ